MKKYFLYGFYERISLEDFYSCTVRNQEIFFHTFEQKNYNQTISPPLPFLSKRWYSGLKNITNDIQNLIQNPFKAIKTIWSPKLWKNTSYMASMSVLVSRTSTLEQWETKKYFCIHLNWKNSINPHTTPPSSKVKDGIVILKILPMTYKICRLRPIPPLRTSEVKIKKQF